MSARTRTDTASKRLIALWRCFGQIGDYSDNSVTCVFRVRSSRWHCHIIVFHFFFFSRFIYLLRNNIAECTTLPSHESISKNCKMLTKKLWDIKTHKLFYPITKLYLWFRSQKQFTKHGTGCRSELNILGKEVYTGYPNSRLHVTTTWWQNLAVTPRSTKILAVRLTRSANKTKRFDAVILISE